MHDKNVTQGVKVSVASRSKAKGAVDLQLNCLKLYKETVDSEKNKEKRQKTLEDKQAEAR